MDNQGVPGVLNPSVIFAFKFPDRAELGSRLRFDCYWDKTGANDVDYLRLPSDDGSILQQVLSVARGMNWKGSVREYLLWQRYVVEYARRGIPRRS